MGKDKNKHKKHTKDKKHKKRERRSPSVSSTSSEEWVEKVEHSSYNNTNENRQARDEWMSLSSSFNTTLSSAKRSMREENRKIEKEEGQYNPKKNVRELNPYWKDGGDGLPNFKKPTERDSYEYSQKKYNHSSSWRKRTINDEEVNKCSKHNSLDNNTITNVISNKDLNVLAAKLVKAELLGNTALAEELKIKLDEAKKNI